MNTSIKISHGAALKVRKLSLQKKTALEKRIICGIFFGF
jgi:hypothetical protein